MKIKYILLLAITFVFLSGKSQIITSVAGAGPYSSGFGGDGGPATSANLFFPGGIALDRSGNMFIADEDNHKIRKVNSSGIISTIAGTTWGYSGDGGQATSARLHSPTSIEVDTTGNIYFADYGNSRIRKIDTSGIITTIAGTGMQGYSGDGGSSLNADINAPDITIDKFGNIYFADYDDNRIRKISVLGIITTVAGTGAQGFSGDGGQAISAELNRPVDLAFDELGNLYFTDRENSRIRMINPSGIISTVAGNGMQGFSGDGGLATSASFWSLGGISIDVSGNLYIGDSDDVIRKIDISSGIITTIVGNFMRSSSFCGDGGPAVLACIYGARSMCFDSSGNMYFSDYWNSTIRKVTYCAAPITMNISGSTNICGGNSVILTVSGSSFPYLWSANAGNATAGTVTITPQGTASYSVTSANGGCIGFDSMTVDVTPDIFINIFPYPFNYSNNTYYVCSGGNDSIKAAGSATSYTWIPGNINSSTIPMPASSTSYTIVGMDNGGCYSSRNFTVNVNPSCFNEIDFVSGKIPQLLVYPNPTNDNFSIETTEMAKQIVKMYDINGRIVLEMVINGKTILDTGNLPSGIYNIQVVSGNHSVNSRVVLVR